MIKPNYGPWIGWNGGECPVDGGVHGESVNKNPRMLDMGHRIGDLSTENWLYVVAYRVEIKPKTFTSVRHWDFNENCTYPDQSLNRKRRAFRLSVTGDKYDGDIAVEWVE